jgi:hypothetical protein
MVILSNEMSRCALALRAIGLRLGVGSKEGIMAMDERTALFASACRATWRKGKYEV